MNKSKIALTAAIWLLFLGALYYFRADWFGGDAVHRLTPLDSGDKNRFVAGEFAESAEKRLGTREPFSAADANGDGLITRNEAKTVLPFNRFFYLLDADFDGNIDRHEFDARRQCEKEAADDLLAGDADKNGAISRAEFAALVAAGKFEMNDAMEIYLPEGEDYDSMGMSSIVSAAGLRRLQARYRATPPKLAPVKNWSERLGTEITLANIDRNRNSRIEEFESQGSPVADCFSQVDANKDGAIDQEEFQALLAAEDDLQKQFQRADANRDGYVSRAEIEAVARKGGYLLPRQFDRIDENKNGELERRDLLRGIKLLAPERMVYLRIEKLKLLTADPFASGDRNRDDRLSPAEGKQDPVLAEHFELVDTDHDNLVTRLEWRTYLDAECAAAGTILAADVDHDDAISRSEATTPNRRANSRSRNAIGTVLGAVFSNRPAGLLKSEEFDELDANKDGRLSQDELPGAVRLLAFKALSAPARAEKPASDGATPPAVEAVPASSPVTFSPSPVPSPVEGTPPPRVFVAPPTTPRSR